MYGDLVSIIMPAYNCKEYIKMSIESVTKQVYQNWELLITDDFSQDGTFELLKDYEKIDTRIKVFRLKKNLGAANARNNSINHAKGKYLAFLDADDVWKEEKLDKQIKYMDRRQVLFTCTAYGKINENSDVLRKVCVPLKNYRYVDLLKWCPGNSTIVYDCEVIGKIQGPDIRKRNDFAMFLQVIKKAKLLEGMEEVLSYHRIREGSISSNKRTLVYFQWRVYYSIEKLGIIKSLYYTLYKVFQTIINKNG